MQTAQNLAIRILMLVKVMQTCTVLYTMHILFNNAGNFLMIIVVASLSVFIALIKESH